MRLSAPSPRCVAKPPTHKFVTDPKPHTQQQRPLTTQSLSDGLNGPVPTVSAVSALGAGGSRDLQNFDGSNSYKGGPQGPTHPLKDVRSRTEEREPFAAGLARQMSPV